MKKLLFPLLAIFVSISAVAQSWYIKPTVGIGQTKLTRQTPSYYEKSMFFKGELAAGREIGKIRIETGLGFLNPSYELKGLTFEDDFNLQTGQAIAHSDIDYNFKYAYLPIRAAYRIKIFAGLSVVPAAGIAALYNIQAERIVTTTRTTPPPFSAKPQVNKLGALADGMLFAEYRVGPVSITTGVSYKRMVNPTFKNGSDRFYFFSGDAGILYHF
ncbi:hypothetical protein [Polluticoccus soli]|uniref:hypothetical protein n=1 Tax=Polluticoccus soli TaxID=3034150 RepID=UPI0023E2D4B4|nr:hypothetical protein [Flavipsychrobacter sp. JY13-12]